MYMHYDDIVNKINEASGLSKVDIEDKVKTKMNQLSGLVSKEGAATIIANELGVKLFQSPLKLKIKNITASCMTRKNLFFVIRRIGSFVFITCILKRICPLVGY